MKPAFGLLSKFRGGANRRGAESELLNLGCGARTHPAWTNVDFRADPPRVIGHDLRTPLPFADGSFSAVYASHVLEHFPHDYAPVFLAECRRVLKPRGIVRIVVPDLEMIARLYLKYLDAALAGDDQAARRHEWMTIELLDQMTRERSGGEMAGYWMRHPLLEEEFVLERMGWEARRFLENHRSQPARTRPAPEAPTVRQKTEFHESGEAHRWMYDRLSLRVLLERAGFSEGRVCRADESRIPGFRSYQLDLNEDGTTRKPDSLFMEAVRS
jgi:predicted SAM-dependent methyltransferase